MKLRICADVRWQTITANVWQLSVVYELNTKNMDYKKKAIRQNAEELFANYFVKGMRNKNITSFKKDYKTLYENVIVPMVEFLIEKQSKLHLDAVMQRSEQLIAFCDWYRTTNFNCEGHSSNDCVDEYLKSN